MRRTFNGPTSRSRINRRLASPDAETTSIPAPPPRMSVVSSSDEDVYWTETLHPVARWNGPRIDRSAYPGIASIESAPSPLPTEVGVAALERLDPTAATQRSAIGSASERQRRRERTEHF